MGKRKLVIIEDSDDDGPESPAGDPPEPGAPVSLTRGAKKKLLANPTWDKKKTRAPSAASKKVAKKTKPEADLDHEEEGLPEDARGSVTQKTDSRPRRYPAADLTKEDVDIDIERLKIKQARASYIKASQESASSIFNDEMAAELDAPEDPYEAMERAEIERDREADAYESDDVDFEKLDDAAMAAQLEAERGSWADEDCDVPQPQSASRTSKLASSGIALNDAVKAKAKDKEDHENITELEEAYRRYQKLKTASDLQANRGVKTRNGGTAATMATKEAGTVTMKSKTPSSATKAKAPSGIRQQRHENEASLYLQRPEWAADHSPIHTPGGKSNSNPGHLGRITLNLRSEPTAEREVKLEDGIPAQPRYPAWTSLVIDVDNPSTLLLTAQHPEVRKVVQNSLIFFWGFFCWTSIYPDSVTVIEYMRKSLLKAAKHLANEVMIDRLSTDADYVQQLSTILSGRVSAWRVKPKAHAVAAISAGYGLSNVNKLRTKAWIKDRCYIYKGDIAEELGTHTLDGTRPYENPTLLSVMEEVFFTGTTSIGARLPSKFKSSLKDKPDEKEVPIPMLAHVATSVYASLKEREEGARVPADFDSAVFENTYKRHVDFLESIRKDAPKKFHAMMHRIYMKVTSGGQLAASASDNKEFSSLFDLSKMADE
ncbi:hypothetical protein FPV67DRAFT_1672208 [Lyophyllum atratum]|nr:hypothetical protein FPV67DRAFT_1672208 [Lyophyllum atratum]